MSSPTTNNQLVELVRKSGLVDSERLEAFLQQPENTKLPPDKPRKLARRLVREGFLTDFQAQQCLVGKWKGFSLGKYRILEQLGSDGLHNAYLCANQETQARLSVQILPAAAREVFPALAWSYPEIRITAGLKDPHVTARHDVECEGGQYLMVAPYQHGTHVRRIVRKGGPLDVTRAAHYGRQVAEGLRFIHENGLFHGAIHPRNLLLDERGTVQILNLGLTRFYQDLHRTEKVDPSFHDPYSGTEYRAPEQLTAGAAIDCRTDVFGLGATCYFMLTGRAPFETPPGTAAPEPAARQLVAVGRLRPEVPEDLAAVVEKMMASDPADRYQTAAEVMEVLAAWTRIPIPPPAPEEMPSFSPAALGEGFQAPREPAAAVAGKTVDSGTTAPRTPPTPMPAHPGKPEGAPSVHLEDLFELGLKDEPAVEEKPAPAPPATVRSEAAEEDVASDRSALDSDPEFSLEGTGPDSEMDLLIDGAGSDSEMDFKLAGSEMDTEEELSLDPGITETKEETRKPGPTEKKEPSSRPAASIRSDPPEERAPHDPSEASPQKMPALAASPTPAPRASGSSSEHPRSMPPRISPSGSRSSGMKKSPAKSPAKPKVSKASGEGVSGRTLLLVLATIVVLILPAHAVYQMLNKMFSDDPISEVKPGEELQGQFEGMVEVIDLEKVYGYAWDRDRPNAIVKVEIYDGSNLLKTVAADIYREDLRARQMGNGKHSFNFELPPSVRDGQPHHIRIVFAGTEKDLGGSPKVIPVPAP